MKKTDIYLFVENCYRKTLCPLGNVLCSIYQAQIEQHEISQHYFYFLLSHSLRLLLGRSHSRSLYFFFFLFLLKVLLIYQILDLPQPNGKQFRAICSPPIFRPSNGPFFLLVHSNGEQIPSEHIKRHSQSRAILSSFLALAQFYYFFYLVTVVCLQIDSIRNYCLFLH